MVKAIRFSIALFVVIFLTFACAPPPTPQPSLKPPESPKLPTAVFTASNLSVTPTEVKPGEKVTITADVKNSGAGNGTYTAELKVNGVTEVTQSLTLEAGTTKTASFSVSRDTPGAYAITLEALIGKFNVIKAPLSRTVTWSDAEFDGFAHKLTGSPPYDYKLHFIDNNKMEVSAYYSFTFGVDVIDGKLRFTDVAPIAWSNIFMTAQKYFDYKDGAMTLFALPDGLSRTMFGQDVDKLPLLESATTENGKISVKFKTP